MSARPFASRVAAGGQDGRVELLHALAAAEVRLYRLHVRVPARSPSAARFTPSSSALISTSKPCAANCFASSNPIPLERR